jgi:hypothetical protein
MERLMASSPLRDSMSTKEWMRRRAEDLGEEQNNPRPKPHVRWDDAPFHPPAPTQQAPAAARPAEPIDPYRTNVFRQGPDGKLHPIEGWRTTGPYDVDIWRRNIDWKGVGDDFVTLAGRVAGVIDPLGAAGMGSPLPRSVIGKVGFGTSLYDMAKELGEDLDRVYDKPGKRPMR